MELGQKVICRPITFYEPDPESQKRVGPQTGRIAYIHPKGRYVTVEFERHGKLLRESFFPDEIQVIK